jgi:hypothetical protein
MKIYSIKEIVNATNSFLKPKTEQKILNKENNKKKLSPKTEMIMQDEEKSILEKEKNYPNKEKPTSLNDGMSYFTYTNIKSFNYKIKLKSEVKNLMIDELYLYLKKKVKKNTLKLIIDKQLEIKNLKNKINHIKNIESELKNNYHILQDNYESVLINNKNLETNKEIVDNKNKELKINNDVLLNNLKQIGESNETLKNENKELKINNDVLLNNLKQIGESNETLKNENKELKNDLNEARLDTKESLEKNRSFEINNFELKNTVSRYIVNTKKIQEKLNMVEGSKIFELDQQNDKVKFYQDENIRLSSELLSSKKINETIKENLNFIETEKEKISDKIKELNKSIEGKTNIVSTPFVDTAKKQNGANVDNLNDKEQKSLDEVISRIFAKI